MDDKRGEFFMPYVMSDIHGDYSSFYNMLVKINFSSFDKLFILGDVVDKGPDNLCLLGFIRSMPNIFLIKGNHEYLFERYLQGTVSAELWDACGGSTTRKEAKGLTEEKKADMFQYLRSLPVYEIVTVGGNEYFLTHSGYNADYDVFHSGTGLIDIKESVDQAVKADQERYLFSNDIHYIPAVLKFDKKIIMGHYPTVLIPGHEMYSIFYGEKYFDIDAGNERREEGGRLACLCLDDGKEFYI